MIFDPNPVFLAVWTTGSDPHRDSICYLEAESFAEDEKPVQAVPPTWLRPPKESLENQQIRRQIKALGFPMEDIESLPGPSALAEILAPLAGRTLVLASDGEAFLRRFRQALPDALEPAVLDLEAVAAFLHPRRGRRRYPDLHQAHLGRPAGAGRPAELRKLAEAMVLEHFERPPFARMLVARAVDDLQAACEESTPLAATWLESFRRLLDRPSRYGRDPESELFRSPLPDGRFGEDLEDGPLEAERNLQDGKPQFRRQYEDGFAPFSPLKADLETDTAFPEEDLKILEAFFDWIPKIFAQENGGAEIPERPGQRALAHAVAGTLGHHRFLLADAPTGTGKTLAYLAPTLLWASAHGLRLGLSTYTRALQEQAFFREIPRALEILRKAGLPQARMPRVSLLKGRANYICGRAIQDAAPEPGDGAPVARATWMRLALFYLEDASADLDGFPLHPGLPLGVPQRVLRQARQQVDRVRALPRCCEGRALLRCAAGIRSLRADRSHLVVTNHAFVLSRPDFFSHLVFDECDHLHEVTVSALSYDIGLDEVEALATYLLRGRGAERPPLARLTRLVGQMGLDSFGERLPMAAEEAAEGAKALDASAFEIGRDLRDYRQYTLEVGDGLSPEEKAFLLRDYLESGRGEALATSLHRFKDAVDLLDSALRTAIEELGPAPGRRARSLRWSFRRPLEALDHWREGLELWLGGESGEKDFSEDLHYEVHFEGRRKPMLSLKWLLPHEWLGRVFFPSLQSAALVSATARVRQGFRAMKGYLGLDILAEDTLDRPGREVLEFTGPPTFDPGQALVCIPEDAPPFAPFGPQAESWLHYVEDVLLYLAERTRGRILGLFTNRLTLQRMGERLQQPMAARGVPLFWQGMPGLSKEELMERFRSRVDSVLLGLDTFWYGVDFPGETCQHIVMTKLPFGALDNYLFAQRARMGFGPHRHRVYLPKALAMFRQGCGRLLRHEKDRGVVWILDRRVLEKRHANFLRELPGGQEEDDHARILQADADSCFQKAFAHMRLGADLERRGLAQPFSQIRGLLHP
ncbi:MAG: ATP-dependent DNA helicase [Planctomycetota bacterium]|nr:MAG: ATP-dependent DNA helicase [Planctomycetota bacterium]